MAQLVSDAEIGNYRTATNFLTLLAILSTPMATALFPAFSKFNIEKEGKELRNLFRMAVKYTSLLLIPATAITMLLSKDLIYTLYGSQYAMAPFFLTLCAVTFLFSGLGSIALASFFDGVGETKLTFKMNLINAVIFVALSLPLVSYLRVPGLIISSLISSLTSHLYGLFTAYRRFNVSINLWASIKTYTASLLSLTPTYLILSVLTLPIYKVFLGGCVFLLSLLILLPLIGAIDAPDLKTLNIILSQVKYVGHIFKILLRFEEKVLAFAILKRAR